MAGGPGAAPPQPQVVLVTCPTSPGPSETEEVVLLSAAGVRLVPVDRREALGVMDVLCGQSSVQDLRVRPRLGKPERQSYVSPGPRQRGWRGPEEPVQPSQHLGQSEWAWVGKWGQRRKSQMPGGGASEQRACASEHCRPGNGTPSRERGWGIYTTHSSIRKCPRKGTGPHWRGQCRGHTWEGDGTTTRRPLAITMFDTMLFKSELKKGDNLRGVRGRVK